jgi:hypothetical protein
MGTWNIGTFDDDTAADFLYDLMNDFFVEIEEVINDNSLIEPDEYDGITIICKLELIVLIGRQKWGGTSFPDVEVAKKWKSQYLTVWDNYMEEFVSSNGETIDVEFRKGRRVVIEKIFDELISLSAKPL